MNGTEDEWLTIEEAKELVPMSISAIYNACKRKSLPHYRLSGSGKRGKVVIRRSDLLRWIEGQRVEPEQAKEPVGAMPKLKHL